MHAWAPHEGPLFASFLAAFVGSLVECVEALTVVLAVASVRGWAGALAGTGLALATLSALLTACGRSLAAVPLSALQLIVGALLLLFGLRWLRKAILRAGGRLPLHDEAAAFAHTQLRLRDAAPKSAALDPLALATSFQIVLLEGGEVVFIVLAVSPGGSSRSPAIAGALAALVLIAAIGLVLHRPLARVPENSLKFFVGSLLSGFGSFWAAEGLGLVWPGGDWNLFEMVLGFGGVGLGLAAVARRIPAAAAPCRLPANPARKPQRHWIPAFGRRLLGLFVDDGRFAAGILAWVVIAWRLIELLQGEFRAPGLVWILPAGLATWLALHSLSRSPSPAR
jgi:uncharacterized membrane protein